MSIIWKKMNILDDLFLNLDGNENYYQIHYELCTSNINSLKNKIFNILFLVKVINNIFHLRFLSSVTEEEFIASTLLPLF